MSRRAPATPAPASRCDGARWLEVAIRVAPTAADRLGTLLVEAGSQGVITGVREPTRGGRRAARETVRGFFPGDDPVRARLAVQAALNRLGAPGQSPRGGCRRAEGSARPSPDRARVRRPSRRLPAALIERADVRWRDLDATLWEMDWREHFQPVAAGRRLLVVPPWHRGTPAGRRRVVIHPGMAFGTGQHETTLSCLEALEDLARPAPARALDVGTGTGILAIALARLGVGRVLAVDTDPQALTAARDNVRRNRLGSRVRLSGIPLERHAAATRYPLVVANLYVGALVGLEPILARTVGAGGRLVTAGVLRSQQRQLRAAFAPPRWRVVRATRRGSWVTTILERRAGRRRTR